MSRKRQIPSYLQHKASGRAYCRVAGKDFYLDGPYGSQESREHYRRFLLQLEVVSSAEALKIEFDRERQLTLWELYERFRIWAGEHYGKGRGSEFQQFKYPMELLMDLFGHDPASEFSPKRLKLVQLEMIRRNWVRSYINRSINRIRQFFKWCVSEEYLSSEIIAGLASVQPIKRGKAIESEPIPAVGWSQLQSLVPWLGEVVAAMAQVQFLCGMRPGEVCALTPSQVDQSGEIWLITPPLHKGTHRGQVLVKAVPKLAQPILFPFLFRPSDKPCFSPQESSLLRGVNPFTRAGRKINDRYSTFTYRGGIVDGFEKAERAGTVLERWSPNALRHGIATVVSHRIGQLAAMRYLGHTDPDTTKIYAERTIQELREIAVQVDQLFATGEAT